MGKVLVTPYKDLMERIIDGYTLEDIVEILQLSSEDILEAFRDKVIESLDQFTSVTTEFDYQDDEEN